MHIYMDAAPIIYLVEKVEPYMSILAARLRSNTIQICSDMTRLECRVKPLRDNDQVLLTAFDIYFANVINTIIPLSKQVIDQATDLRARYNFKTPDAIHLAAAIEHGCDIFLTHDQVLERCQEIKVELLSGE